MTNTISATLSALRGFAGALAALCALLAGANAAELLDVRFGPGPQKTRIVVDVMGAAAFSISGDEEGAGRIRVRFANIEVPKAMSAPRPGRGLVKGYAFATLDDGAAEAIFTLGATAAIKEAFMLPPKDGLAHHRLVIDLQPATKKQFLASLPTQYPDLEAVIRKATADSEAAPLAVPKKREKEVRAPEASPVTQVIVVDAGHGGRDPGAQGQSGTLEKRVTLAAALELKAILEKRGGYRVVLTRAGDEKIQLDDREAIAREANADLFISLHADAVSQKHVRGGSVYTLSKKGSARAAQLAKSEGDYHVYDLDVAAYGEEVGDILFDLARGTTNEESGRFADLLLARLEGETPLVNRARRTGDLRVLLAPDVPAVLFEMAFMSNVRDEANLNSPAWRKRTMTAVADAIDAYFDERAARRFAASRAAATN